MAVTSYKAPTAASGTNRTNPTNVYASDDSRATYANSAQNNLYVTGFDFSGIPSGSTIVGVEVIVEGNGGSATAANRSIKVGMTKDGSSLSGSFLANQNLPRNTDGSLIFGSPTNLFSTTISYSELQASSWGIVIAVGNTNTSERRIDQVIARVYYTNTTAAPASLVQSKTGNSSTYVLSHNFSFDSAVTSGNLIVIGVVSGGYEIASITDSASNTYTRIQYGNTANLRGALRYAYNVTGGSLTITLDVDGASNYDDICYVAYEFEGVPTTDPLDVSAENVEGGYDSAHPTGTTGTTNQADEIVVAMYGGDSNTTYHILEDDDFGEFIDTNGSDLYQSIVMTAKEVSSTGTQAATFVSVAFTRGYGAIATFKLNSSQDLEDDVSDGLEMSEDTQQAIGQTVSDGLEMSENVIESVGKSDSVSDGLDIAEATQENVGQNSIDGLELSEVTQEAATESQSDGVELSELTSENVGTVVSDGIEISEVIVEQKHLHDTVSDTINIGESTQEAVSELASDGISIAEETAESKGLTDSESDTITLSEVVTELQGKSDTVSDVLNLSEQTQQAVGEIESDVLTLGEAQQQSISETEVDNLSLQEATQENVGEVVSDGIEITEIVNESVGKSDSVSDTIQLSETEQEGVGSTVLDTITLEEQVQQGTSETISDGLLMSEEIVEGTGLSETVSDTIQMSENTVESVGASDTVSDEITLSDVVQNSVTEVVDDEIDLSEVLVQVVGETVVDTIEMSENVTAISPIRGISVTISQDVYTATITQDQYTMTVTPDLYTSTISVDSYSCNIEVDTYTVTITT